LRTYKTIFHPNGLLFVACRCHSTTSEWSVLSTDRGHPCLHPDSHLSTQATSKHTSQVFCILQYPVVTCLCQPLECEDSSLHILGSCLWWI